MIRRAHYSEPIDEIKGTLHITNETFYVEVIAEIDGKKRFMSFGPDEIASCADALNEVHYFESHEDCVTAQNKLADILSRAEGLQKAIFDSPFSLYKVVRPIETQENPTIVEATSEVNNSVNEDDFDEFIAAFSEELQDDPFLEDVPEVHVDDVPIVVEVPDDEIEVVEVDGSGNIVSSEKAKNPELQKYIDAFSNIRNTSSNPDELKYKALVLLSVIALFEEGDRKVKRIIFNSQFKNIFLEKGESYLSGDPASIEALARDAFEDLKYEPFWHRVNPVYTPSGTVSHIADLDESLSSLLRYKTHRRTLRKLLYSKYL